MTLIDIKDLHVEFDSHDGVVSAVRGVSFNMEPGQSLGIVGESGSGKSVTLMALMRLLNAHQARITADKLSVLGQDLNALSDRGLSNIRGNTIAMIFQDPMTSFDPLFTIGHQIVETIRAHETISKKDAYQRARDLLGQVEIKNVDNVLRQYPHQLSGGMLQRSMIAMALSCYPTLLVADEPTTALDVTVQAQILQLIKDLQAQNGMSLVIITHDLGVVAETTDKVVVMYGGKVMETADTLSIFEDPRHPYTKALIQSIPGQTPGKQRLKEIPGSSPNALSPPNGCPFHPRCSIADSQCAEAAPELQIAGPDRTVACWKAQV